MNKFEEYLRKKGIVVPITREEVEEDTTESAEATELKDSPKNENALKDKTH